MKSFASSIVIRATPEAIWALLTHAEAYPAWNSTVEKVVGRIALGEKVTVHAKVAPGRAFPVSVAEFDPPKRMVWSGGRPFGLFTGKRTFTLTPASSGAITFAMREEFSDHALDPRSATYI